MSPQAYQQVSLNDLNHNEEPALSHNQPKTTHWGKKLPLTTLLIALLATTSLLLGYLTTTPPPPPNPPPTKFGTHPNQSSTCGTTPTTARTANCTFDILTFAWQSPPCYDHTLVEDFTAVITGEFFTDNIHPEPLEAEVVLRGERDVRAHWEFHVRHCRYMFRRLLRAVRGGGVVDGKLGGYEHVCGFLFGLGVLLFGRCGGL